jgi:hypothetical protein
MAQLRKCSVVQKEERDLKFFKAMAVSTLLLGSECWTLNNRRAKLRKWILRTVTDDRRTHSAKKTIRQLNVF